MELEKIKNFSLNTKLNTYKDYINYFYKLDLNSQTDIISIMIDYKKYNDYNIKNGNLDKLYNAYKILLHKLEYDELNIKERDIYENITAYLIIANEFIQDKYFSLYCKKYLNNVTIHNFNRRIFLIMQDVLNILNKYNNKNINFLLTDTIDYAGVDMLDNEYKNKILLNEEEFIEYYYNNVKVNINLIEEIIYIIFVVCHEYTHIIQKDYMYTNNDSKSNIYKNDLYILGSCTAFYTMFHDNFYVENEANNFGILDALNYIKKYFRNTELSKEELEDYLYDEADIEIKNKLEYLILYKLHLLIIKTCLKTNIKTETLKEVDNLYKTLKKSYNNKNSVNKSE